MYLNMAIFIQMTNDKINWLSWTVVLILSVEVYAILTEVYQMSQSVSGIDPGKLKGVTANRNIGAFSIAIKIPFALFILQITKNRILKLYLFGLIFLSLFSLSFISSRASYVAVLILIVIVYCTHYFNTIKSKRAKKLSTHSQYYITVNYGSYA